MLGLVLRAAVADDADARRKMTEMLGLSREGLAHHTAAIAGLAEVLTARPLPEGREG